MSGAITTILDSSGVAKGTVFFEQLHGESVKVTFNLYGFIPGAIHAIHIHEFGDLSRGCSSLGEHYNPTRAKHGKHKGDLIKNFQADILGSFSFSYVDNLNVNDLYGRSVVIHALPDDLGNARYNDLFTRELMYLSRERGYRIGPRKAMIEELNRQSTITGNAGRRIACGIIGRSSGK